MRVHTACLQPSLFHYSRSRTLAPPMAERMLLAQYPDLPAQPHPCAIAGAYHPIVRAVARPGCVMHTARLVCATSAQVIVDVLAGASALGCATLCALMGRGAMAQALITEHKLQFVVMATAAFALAMAAAVGGAVGAAAFMMAA